VVRWHSVDDPNEIIVLFEASDVGKAKAFAASPDLKERMTAAGVIGHRTSSSSRVSRTA
jgi:hypothetical protein